jgi:type IV secretory pathway TraG/TraD family ATPase VirD4
MTSKGSLSYLSTSLKNTEASRYFAGDNKITANSILSVLATNSKPISYLVDHSNNGNFSLKEYFSNLKQGSDSWLFLASKPSGRELTLPLIACLTELAFSQLIDIGIDQNRRVWLVIDELASLGKLPALSTLMAEGRKYGASIIAGVQSLNQIYDHYGSYAGSAIFGQFGTNFFFRNNEPAIAKMVSNMCGTETINRQQKNISFGANEFRDGISYHEQQQKKDLVEYSDLAGLAIGQCYALLPEPSVRIVKLQTAKIKQLDKNLGFVAINQSQQEITINDRNDNSTNDQTNNVSALNEIEVANNFKVKGQKKNKSDVRLVNNINV